MEFIKMFFLVDNNKILFLTTFITLTAIFFSKKQASCFLNSYPEQ